MIQIFLRLLPVVFLCVVVVPSVLFGQESFDGNKLSEVEKEELITELEAQGNLERFEGEVVVIAKVGIDGAQVLEQRGREFVFEFDITNEGDLQPEVLYAIQLYKTDERGEMYIEGEVFPEVLDVRQGDVIHREITYAVPESYVGTYILRMVVGNKRGFEYSGATLGEYTFEEETVASNYFLDPRECYTVVENEEIQHGLLEGVDLNPEDETLYLVCENVPFEINEEVQAQFDFYERSLFGSKTEEKGFASSTVTDEGILKIAIPTPQNPQSYLTEMALSSSDDVVSTNPITFRFVIQGESATIKNVSLNKNKYDAGEDALVKVLVSGYADVFPEARGRDVETYDFEANAREDLSVSLQVSSNNIACSEEKIETLSVYGYELFEIAVPITTDCPHPTATVKVTNPDGKILSDAEFSVENDEPVQNVVGEDDVRYGFLEIGVIIITALTILGVLIVFMIRHKKSIKEREDYTETTNDTTGSFLMLFLLVLGTLCGAQVAYADNSFYVNGFSSYNSPFFYEGWSSLEDSSVSCGGSIVGESKVWIGMCDNMRINLDTWIAGSQVVDIFHDSCSHSGGATCPNWSYDSGWRTYDTGAKTSNGSIDFRYRLERLSWTSGFVDDRDLYETYTVGACIDFDHSANVTSCARTGDASRNGVVNVSITNVTGGTASSYGFRCGAQPWVTLLSSNTHTCVFDAPGTYNIQFRIYNASGSTLRTESQNVTVLPCPCNAPTIDLTVNGVHGTAGGVNTNVNQDESFDVSWSFSNPGETYACTFAPPSVSTLAVDTVHSRSGMDSISYPGDAPGTLFPYRFTCNGPDVCADVTRRVNVSVTPTPLEVVVSVGGETSDGVERKIYESVRWLATPSGGVPPYSNFTWSGDITGATIQHDPAFSTADILYGTLGIKRVTVRVTDAWGGTPAEDSMEIEMIDDRTPQ